MRPKQKKKTGTVQLFQKSPKVRGSIRKNLVLSAENEDFLDDFIHNVRRATRSKLTESGIVRALIEALQEKNINPNVIHDAEDIKDALLQ